jgi:hypothetical protein
MTRRTGWKNPWLVVGLCVLSGVCTMVSSIRALLTESGQQVDPDYAFAVCGFLVVLAGIPLSAWARRETRAGRRDRSAERESVGNVASR